MELRRSKAKSTCKCTCNNCCTHGKEAIAIQQKQQAQKNENSYIPHKRMAASYGPK